MSGIRVGSRLEQLLALRERVDLQIEIERRQNPPARAPKPAKRASRRGFKRPDQAPRMAARMARLDELGVTQREVKAWAVEEGLLDEVRRGSVAEHLIEAYAEAHP